MLRIGLTGGIGSGKTTVSKIFADLGVPIFNSDKCARELENHPDVQRDFKELFGEDIFINGELDRPRLRSIVFVDMEILQKLNAIVVPHIKREFEEFCTNHADKAYCILESAILFETGVDNMFDEIITVIANMDVRIKRVIARDKISDTEVMNKINSQWSDQDKIDRTRFIVINNGDDLLDALDGLTNQIIEINKRILSIIKYRK